MKFPTPDRSFVPTLPPGVIVYAIDDVHGRCDLVEGLLDEIESERRRVGSSCRVVTVFLGDYIDRGAESREVLDRLIELERAAPRNTVFLRGNHEQVLLDLLDDVEPTARWVKVGGLETLASYGVSATDELDHDVAHVRSLIRKVVPPEHIEFLKRTAMTYEAGDYVFAHAGLRPDRLLEEQSEEDLLWFRYYDDQPPVHRHFVVHGHSPNDRPVVSRWRAGIDTGAYDSGVLTALRLQGADRLLLKSSFEAGRPSVTPWDETDQRYAPRQAKKAPRPVQAPAPEPTPAPVQTWRPTPQAANIERPAAVASAPHQGALRTSPRRRAPGASRRLLVMATAAIICLALGYVSFRLLEPRSAEDAGKPTASRSRAAVAQSGLAAAEAAPAGPQMEVLRLPSGSGEPAVRSNSPDTPRPASGVQDASGQTPPLRQAQLAPAVSAPPAGGQERVQIGALPTEALAQQAGRELLEVVALESPLATAVERADVRGRTYYRSMVVGFSNRSEAAQFCSKLARLGHDCIIR